LFAGADLLELANEPRLVPFFLYGFGKFYIISSITMLSTVSRQLRSHPALIPLLIFIGGGCTIWDKKNNPEPWNKLGPNDQYKV
uniref:Cytochrome c oxidase subunit NDUFA4 n=1 Tax=Sinocyclocheilus rhinocerous TaxID=307959 RepID=A0A673KL24_9TELE